MFDFGLAEILVIAVLGILVIGPKELPVIMVQVGRVFKRLNYMRFAVSRQFEDFMAQAGLDDVKDQVNFEAADIVAEPLPQDAHAEALAAIEKPVVVQPKTAVKSKKVSAKPRKSVVKKKSPVKKKMAVKAKPKAGGKT